MLRLSANISTMFTELPPLERLDAAAHAGFAAVEMQFPYELDRDALVKARTNAEVAFVLINIPAGRLDRGELGLAGLPGREADFREAVEQAVDYALALGCPQVNCLAGRKPEGETIEQCHEILRGNVAYAAERLSRRGIRLLVEPLNRADNPGVLIGTTAEGLALLDSVGHPNAALQYDIYHARAAGEDWLGGLVRHIDHIGHVQFSDYPGRGAPGSGTLDFARFWETMRTLPYGGWTGAEYRPEGYTADSLDWLRQHR